MNRLVVVLLGAALVVAAFGRAPLPAATPSEARGLASPGSHAVQESLSRVHPRMRASWLRERGLDDSYYTTLRRPESTGLRCIGRWPWGPSWELAGRDTFLYLGSGSGVRILSIADSVQPRMLGQINARSLVSGLAVHDTLLFVACGSWDAQIYSVSDPSNPRELGSMDAVISTICAQDTVCFTLGGDSLTIYDVANPGQPVRLAAVQDAGGILAFNNGYVFSAGSGGLNVYDVHVPAAPTWVGSRGGSYLGLFARGTLLFCTGIQPSYFTILDVSNPASMVQLGTIDGCGGEDICVLGHLACLSCVYDNHGLYTIDVSDSTHPQLLGNYVPDGAEFFDVYIRPDGLRSCIASWYGGLSVGDISNPNAPHQAWFGYQADQAVDVAIDGSRAYVSDLAGGMRILDVSNPSVPTELASYDTTTLAGVRTAVARDSFAFICRDGSVPRKFLRVLDVLDPSNPTLVAQESCYNPPEDYVLSDSFLYAAEANMFQVFNVARPREPVRMGSCNSQDGVYFGLAVQDTFAYIAADGLQVISIARPDSPAVVNTIDRTALGVAVRDTFVYLPYVSDTLLVYSAADPANIRLLSSVPAGVYPSDVALGELKAYVSSVDGIDIYSLDNPARPVHIGRVTGPAPVYRLRYSGGLVYAALQGAGMAIYETTAVGISESKLGENKRAPKEPSVVRGVFLLEEARGHKSQAASLLDVSGRKVLDLHPGANDVQALAPGVYFVREAQAQAQAQAIRKVIKLK